ncbi:hypothetical protein G436_0179 [Leptospira interrogans serovar Hardjo str. Norma]|uniref:Uncharacterized protein n=1 Tax=Leptospira interrogans serovar Hardjo str. Norma TaxID=1279460 RepID=A0A0M5L8C0_LEPIR|nr:hypothetical protein G436_0179 [Leptospira interrogans serovar Hardjo str. Norma]
MLKNFLVPINKTALIARFHKIETDGELIFQQFYLLFRSKNKIGQC